MPHAFRSSASIEAEAAQKKIDRLRDRWASTRDTWFDGTPASVDRRIGWVDEVISTAKNTAGRLTASKAGADAMSLLPQLRADRDALIARRDRLAGGDWVPMGVDPHAHNLDPRQFDSREEWMDAQNKSRFGEFGEEYGQQNDYPVPSLHQDMTGTPLHSAAVDFIESENTTDRTELRVRAQRLMEDRTWSWDRTAARDAVRAFVGAVDALAPRQQRVASARPAVMQDFDDAMLFG